MIQGKINIKCANVILSLVWKKQRRDRSTHKDNRIPELTQNVNQFHQHRTGCLYFSFSIIFFCNHNGSMACLKRNCAASSPLPLKLFKSRYNWIGETTGI